MRAIVASFGSGALFALGLALGGMTQPAKVVGFLDFLGRWDPSLALVMVGAIGVYLPANRLVRRRRAPLCAAAFATTDDGTVDLAVVAGAAVFGAGWGLAGYCPGPVVASIGAGSIPAAIVAAGMIAGMIAVETVASRRGASLPACGQSAAGAASTPVGR